ncbi:MAG: SMI1/KNR4 family protein [Cyanobacteria bacterium P01_B01_bin.77]
MTSFNWSEFLTQWSQDILESNKNRSQGSQTQAEKELQQAPWLGYAGATEEQISAVEARLGITLPPSYRAFLKASNGWKETTPFIKRLWSVDKITWFAANHPDWLRQWIQRYHDNLSVNANGASSQSLLSDEDYFVYGDDQDCRHIIVNYLETALEISEVNDAAIYLLNPDVVTEDGEWEAWFLADWLPGADRYPSFRELMQAEYLNSQEMRTPLSEVEIDSVTTNNNNAVNTSTPNSTDSNPNSNATDWSGVAIDNVAQWLLQTTFPLASNQGDSLYPQPQIDQIKKNVTSRPISELPTVSHSQQWSGIEVNEVCHWMIEQVAQTAFF